MLYNFKYYQYQNPATFNGHMTRVFWCIFKFWSKKPPFFRIGCVKKLHYSSRYFMFFPICYLQYIFLSFPYFSQIFHPADRVFMGTSQREPRPVGIDKTPGTCSIRARLTSTTKIIRQSRVSTGNALLSAQRKVWDSYFFTPVRPGKTSNFWNNEKTNDTVQSNLMAF